MTELHVVSIIEPVGGYGGMDFYDYGLARGLAETGIEVRLYTCNETPKIDAANLTTLPYFGNVWKQAKLRKLLAFVGGYKKSFDDSKRKGAQIIHLHFFQVNRLNLYILKLARRYPFKIILTLHDVDPLVNQTSERIHRKMYAIVDGVIVHNAFSKSELSQKKIDPNKITIIPHGNYLPFITPRKKTASTPEKLRLLFFGQIKEVKGLEVLLKALAIAIRTNPNIDLVIAGRPWRTKSDEYIRLIHELGLENHVKPTFEYIPNEQVADYFANCDLVVLPYKRIYQSGVLLLSMSYGKPCLTSDLPPFLETIEHGENGFVFQSESAENLSAILLEIAAKRNVLEDVSQKAMRLLKTRYDWHAIGIQTKAFYTKLLN